MLVALGAALTLGTWLSGTQGALAESVVRLHVIANSDSQADQALKLEVRDAVLEESGAFLSASTVEEARAQLTAALPRLEETARAALRRAGCGDEVKVTLEENCWFPTKEYGDFALPAGEYTALRVVIGQGGGRNWWCVLFPPLCLGAVSESVEETAAAAGLSQDQISLISGEDQGYVVRFRLLEWWDSLLLSLGAA